MLTRKTCFHSSGMHCHIAPLSHYLKQFCCATFESNSLGSLVLRYVESQQGNDVSPFDVQEDMLMSNLRRVNKLVSLTLAILIGGCFFVGTASPSHAVYRCVPLENNDCVNYPPPTPTPDPACTDWVPAGPAVPGSVSHDYGVPGYV